MIRVHSRKRAQLLKKKQKEPKKGWKKRVPSCPPGTAKYVGSLREPTGKEHQLQFRDDIVRTILRSFAHSYIMHLKEEDAGKISPRRRLGSLQWMLTGKKGKRMPRRCLMQLTKWLNLKQGGDSTLLIIEFNVARMLDLLKTNEGARYFAHIFTDPEFRRDIKNQLNDYRRLERGLRQRIPPWDVKL
jgi:hypothetical protein